MKHRGDRWRRSAHQEFAADAVAAGDAYPRVVASMGGRGCPRGLRRGAATGTPGTSFSPPLEAWSPRPLTPGGRRCSSPDCSRTVRSLVGLGTLSGTSTNRPVSPSTATWVSMVCCCFSRLEFRHLSRSAPEPGWNAPSISCASWSTRGHRKSSGRSLPGARHSWSYLVCHGAENAGTRA